jgi:hypothetical protein
MTGVSFCIITGGDNDNGIREIINSIEVLEIPNYEVIVVGGESTTLELNERVKHIPFDENVYAHITLHGAPGRWTTRKKNLAGQASQYEICVVFHDYIVFDPNWYKELLAFGPHWDVLVNQCQLIDGSRGDGWRIDRHPLLPRWAMVPYDMEDLVQYMMIQGNFFMIKREWFLENPFDEKLLWGMEEDAEWSRRVVPKSHIRCNPKCIIRYNKERPFDYRPYQQDLLNYEHVFATLRACRMDHFKLCRE